MMKLLISLTVIFCFQVSITGYSQTVTLSVNKASLENVFKEVNKQTGFHFVYTRAQLKKSVPVTLNVVGAELNEVLITCFRNQPLTFVIDENYIVVQTKNIAPQISQQTDSVTLIKGSVMNENGEPLEGATVIAKHSKRGVSTNKNGDFILESNQTENTLLISSVGYASQEIPVITRTIFVTLKLAINSLEETIVKGYYSTTRLLNTGSVVKVRGTQILNQPISNPILGLEGLVPGLLITQTNGLPGSRFTSLIRGQNSIQNGNSPLFIIDGVPFLSDKDALTQLNGLLANSPFNTLDPNNIESIEILKDADATAIYGSRGANGVILIHSKKITAEKNNLSLNVYRGWGKVTRTLELMNTQQYLEMRREAFLNDAISPTIINAPDLITWDPNRYTDWKKDFIGGTSQTFNGQLRYSGGNQFTRFSVGSGYYNETTVFPGSFGEKKATVNVSINHTSQNKKIILNFITSYGSNSSQLPGQDLTAFTKLPPNGYPLIDANGKFVWREAGYSVGNPLALLKQTNDVRTDRLTASNNITYKITDAFEIRLNLGYNKVYVNERIVSPILSQDPAFSPTGSSVYGDSYSSTWIIEPQASQKFILLKKLHLEILAGSTWQKTESERKLINCDGYTSDQMLGSIADAPYLKVENSKAEYKYAAVFGRLGFDWNTKYIFNISDRRDASSRFGPDNRFANFAALGMAWIFSKEPYFKDKFSFLSLGKIRGSVGTSGNDQIGNYQYLDTYRATVFPYQDQPGLTPSRLFNPNYSWEQNNKIEVAAELGFFQNNLTVNLNFYKNQSNNQIIRYSLPGQTGFSDVLMNFPGIVQNRGYEVSMASTLIKKDHFQWNAALNISSNKNKLLSFPGLANSSYASTYVLGKPLNAFIGVHFNGVDPQTGVYEFQDLNQNGSFDKGDYQYQGATDPKYFGGFLNSLFYKGFQLNILLEFRKQLGRHALHSSGGIIGALQNGYVYSLNRWQIPGDISPIQKYSQNYTGTAAITANLISQSNAVLTDASYLRVKNIILSYDFPSKWLKRLHALNGKLFCQMQNILTITKYKGNDPESQSLASLPLLRIIATGISINF
ncbi:MAG: SusC/RagA family TonB-linked outer membrane protein [Ginsengibacter sp.]